MFCYVFLRGYRSEPVQANYSTLSWECLDIEVRVAHPVLFSQTTEFLQKHSSLCVIYQGARLFMNRTNAE